MNNGRFREPADSISSHQTAAAIRPSVRDAVRRALLVMAPTAIAVFGGGTAVANPDGGVVVRGNATINGGAGTLNVNQASQRAVINWRSFSIGQNETVNFNQPSSSASTLNRVTGSQRSVIEGALNANGRVYLINSSGVLFTGSSQVNVGTLVATTANITDDNFMADRLEFREAGQPGASIENFGQISVRDGGLAALVAPSVRNAGLIQANVGRIALGGGELFTLDFYGDRLINFSVGEGNAGGTAPRLDNSGALLADGGHVLLTTQAASDVVGGVVNMSGVIQARSVSRDAMGTIVLDAAGGSTTVSGHIDASGSAAGTSGGRVELLGQSVAVQGGATIDASGHSGGGTVHVGGPPASEASANRAASALVEQGAAIDASAHESGNGGTVSIWGTNQARFAGEIRAAGGETAGDGGFVEVSSRGVLQFLGDVIASAENGAPGTVLLDPADIVVQRSGSSDPNASVIDGDALNRLLRTQQRVNLIADDTITVNYRIDGRPLDGGTAPSGDVRMTAGAIIINAPVITNDAPISLNAGAGGVTFGENPVTMEGPGFLWVASTGSAGNVGGSDITIDTDGSVIAGTPDGDAGQLISLGTISITARGEQVALHQALNGLDSASGGTTGIGSLIVTAANGRVAMAGVYARGGAVTVEAADGIANSGSPIQAAGDITLHGGSGEVRIAQVGSDPGTFAVETTSPGAGVALETTGPVTLNGSVGTAGGDLMIGSEAPTGGVSMASGTLLQTAGTDYAGDLEGQIGIYTSGAATLGNLIAGSTRDVHVMADGDVFVGTGLFGIEGAEDLDDDGDADGQGLGSLTIESGGTISLAGVTSSGAVNVRAAAGITNRSGSILVTGAGSNVLLATDSGEIDLTASGSAADAAVVALAANSRVTLESGGGAVNLHNGLRTAGGALQIGSNTVEGRVGSVTSDPGALLETQGAGNIAVYANGGIALTGVTSGGAVTLDTDGSLSNSGKSIVANGTIRFVAGNGGITLATIDDDPSTAGVEARNSDASIALMTPGTVTLRSSVLTAGGALRFGTDVPAGRVGSVSAAPNAVLQTGGAGDVEIFSNGDLTLAGVTSGGGVTLETAGGVRNTGRSITADGSVSIVAGDDGVILGTINGNPAIAGIEVRTPDASISIATPGAVSLGASLLTAGGGLQLGTNVLEGRVGSVSAAPDAILQTVGMGDVAIFATGAVDLAGVNAGGGVTLDTGGLITNGGKSIVAGGDVSLIAGAGGISLDTLKNSSGQDDPTMSGIAVTGESSSISVQTSGAVMLDASLRTQGGDILIGTENLPDAVVADRAVLESIQLNGEGGRIEVRSAAAIELGRVVLGSTGGLIARGGLVSVAETISGPTPPGDTDDPLPGVGYVDLEAPVVISHGIQATGQRPNGVTYGVRLTTPENSEGSTIDILGAGLLVRPHVCRLQRDPARPRGDPDGSESVERHLQRWSGHHDQREHYDFWRDHTLACVPGFGSDVRPVGSTCTTIPSSSPGVRNW